MRWLVVALCALAVTKFGYARYCAQRREISPCSCRIQEAGLPKKIILACELMLSYGRVSDALSGRFSTDTPVTLEISHSAIDDIAKYSISNLGLSINKLKLNHDNISELDSKAFEGLVNIEYLSLADNNLPAVPSHILRNMPNIRTLDLARSRIRTINARDFKDLPYMHHLLLRGNELNVIEKGSLPDTLRHLHLGHNRLFTLNGTVRHMDQLEWLFINVNNLTSIDNEIPMNAKKLVFIHASNNQLERLPLEIRSLTRIDALYFHCNRIKALNGAIQKSRWLRILNISSNIISQLAYDDFAEVDNLEYMDLSNNKILYLNGSLKPLRSLKYLNLSRNEMAEFSLQEIKGLKRLWVIDLSHNKITQLTGHTENLVELETRLLELRLDHNRLTRLGGTLMGLHGLLNLNLSHNQLDIISPDDFIGLDELQVLDISYNNIVTLMEFSKTLLPVLEHLFSSNNKITSLHKDFHGLPFLCTADLSNNLISTMNPDLVSKTNCNPHKVPVFLKINLNENPILCDEMFTDLYNDFEKLHTRIIGECPKKPLLPLPPPAQNDIIPADSRPTISIVPLERQNRQFHGLVGHIMQVKNIQPVVDSSVTATSPLSSTAEPIIQYKEPSVLESAPETVHHAYVRD